MDESIVFSQIKQEIIGFYSEHEDFFKDNTLLTKFIRIEYSVIKRPKNIILLPSLSYVLDIFPTKLLRDDAEKFISKLIKIIDQTDHA